MELQESKVMCVLQDDIEVRCIVQWELLWWSAQNHLNKRSHLKPCGIGLTKRSSRQWRPCSLHILGTDTRRGQFFLQAQKAMMVQYMQGGRHEGWYLGGQPDVLAENEDGDPNHE